jgi:hypothetical protein
MEELIARISAAAGIDAGLATKAVGMILNFLQKEGPAAEVSQLIGALPGAEAAMAANTGGGGLMGGLGDILFGSTGPRGGRQEGLAQSMARSAVRTMGTTVGREIIRGVLGSLLGGGSRRR